MLGRHGCFVAILEVLESCVTKRRNRAGPLKFLGKSMKRCGEPQVIVADRLLTLRCWMNVIGNTDRQETGHWLNSRTEISHRPFRRRERAILRLRRTQSLQKFGAVHSFEYNHFNSERPLCGTDSFSFSEPPLCPSGSVLAPDRLMRSAAN